MPAPPSVDPKGLSLEEWLYESGGAYLDRVGPEIPRPARSAILDNLFAGTVDRESSLPEWGPRDLWGWTAVYVRFVVAASRLGLDAATLRSLELRYEDVSEAPDSGGSRSRE